MKALIISAHRYDFADKETGRQIRSTSIYYTIEPRDKQLDTKGADPIKGSGPVELFEQIGAVPGLYDLDVEPVQRNGAVTLRVVGARSLAGATAPATAPAQVAVGAGR
jgi:hypothetical protein